ncbi:MAG: hypothetical protein M3198_02765 [Actinomycetota bacterium]|nr:hypothetical protein [Actinomycetota bacterium]
MTHARATVREGLLPYILLAISFVLLAFYGTGIYNFFIPTVVQQRDFSLGLYALAIVGGTAAFLSPCAFGMLPAYFGFFLSFGESVSEGDAKVRKGVTLGAAAAGGLVTVAVVLGILILVLGSTFAPTLRIVTPVPNPFTRGLRIVAGVLLLVLGIQQMRGRSLLSRLGSLPRKVRERMDRAAQQERSPLGFFYLYGILYLLVALPCVANVMAAPLLFAFATQGLAGAVVTQALFLLTMATLMVMTSVGIGMAGKNVLVGLRASGRTVGAATGALIALMGAALVYLDIDRDAFRRLFFHFPIK